MTDENIRVHVLPDNSIAVMVHKQFVDRVKDFLLLPLDYQIPWKVLRRKRHDQNSEETIDNQESTTQENTILCPTVSVNATLLDTTETSGMSHDRQGFQVLCCENTIRPIHTISPLARQNMAWAVKLTHYCAVARSSASMGDIASRIVETLPLKDVPMILPADKPCTEDHKLLRVDVYPKPYTESLCLGLQRAYHTKLAEQSTTTPSHPFGGPIAMTRSASKCSHRLAIIISTRDTVNGGTNGEAVGGKKCEATTIRHVYWGWMDRENPADHSIMAIKVNEFANHEIQLVAPDHVTGKEVGDGAIIVPVETPLSRAYYKLDQVWDDILELHEKNTLAKIAGSSAVDFGSAPGGWTQVLAFRGTGFPTICSVDKGVLAERIAKIAKVRYIPSLAENSEADIEPYEPFGLVVCDASLLWSEAMDLFQNVVAHRAPNCQGQETRPNKFTLPCVFVITLKLPFQTLPSIQRHIHLIKQRLPQYLSRMASAMCTNGEPIVQARHTLVHLMANSRAERTLIAIFEEPPSSA